MFFYQDFFFGSQQVHMLQKKFECIATKEFSINSDGWPYTCIFALQLRSLMQIDTFIHVT